jgi:hypothetical protein
MDELQAWVSDPAVPDRLMQAGVGVYETLVNDKIGRALGALNESLVQAIPRFATSAEASAAFDRVISSVIGPDWRPGQPDRNHTLTETREALVRMQRAVVWYLTHIDALRAASTMAELQELIRQDTEQLPQLEDVPFVETLRERWTQVRDQRLIELAN